MSKYNVVILSVARAYTSIEASSKKQAREILQRCLDDKDIADKCGFEDSLIYTGPELFISEIELDKTSK